MSAEKSYELQVLHNFSFGQRSPSPFPSPRVTPGELRNNNCEEDQIRKYSVQSSLIEFDSAGNKDQEPGVSAASKRGKDEFSIHSVVACSEIEKLKHILSSEANRNRINEPDTRGFIPLQIAARLNNAEAASILIQNGASINYKSVNGDAPIHTSLRHRSSAVFTLLIEHNAAVTITDKNGATPLHIACMKSEHSDVALLLSVTKENINDSDQFGMKPIHYAAMGGNLSICDLLMKCGADPKETTSFGGTLLMVAANNSSTDVMQLVLKKIKEQKDFSPSVTEEFVNLKTKDGRTALHWAAICNNVEAVKLLLENGATVNEGSCNFRYPLHFAARLPNITIMKQLIDSGAFLEPRDSDGRAPLHYAAMGGTEESVKYLISAGAQVDCKAKNGHTPLFVAVLKARVGIVKTLLRSGASPFLEDLDHKTCLHRAVDVNNIPIIEELVSVSYVVNLVRDANGRTAMHYAAFLDKSKVLRALIEKSSIRSPVDLEGKTPLHIAAENGSLTCIGALLEDASSELINNQDIFGDTPLHSAASKGHNQACEMLVIAGADLNQRNKNGQTPLHIVNSFTDRHSVLQKLLITDADPEIKDNKGDTPLITAVKFNNIFGVKALLDSGASLSTTNSNGHNALEAAIAKGQEEACLAILQHERWKEALTEDSCRQQTILSKMVEFIPQGVGIVLDKSISFSGPHSSHPDLKFTYDFGYLEPTPEVMKSKKVYTILPTKMVKYSREELLLHPVTKEFLNLKWKTLGRYLYYASFLFYVFYLITMTYLVITENDRNIAQKEYAFLTRQNQKSSSAVKMPVNIEPTPFAAMGKNNVRQIPRQPRGVTPTPSIKSSWTSQLPTTSKGDGQGANRMLDPFAAKRTGTVGRTFKATVGKPKPKPSEGGLGKVLGGFTLCFAIIMLVKEFVQMYLTGMSYLKDLSNYIEVILYSFSIFYLLEFLVKLGWKNSNTKYQLGIVTLVFIYLNMLLYLQRVTIFKLYIVMFLQVVVTLIRVFGIFSVAVVGFAITFYQMFPKQDTFSSVLQALVKVLVMLTGELDYESIMTSNLNQRDSKANYPLVPFVDLSYTLLVVFILILGVGLMNLLVGLAVGDIQTIRRHARMQAEIQDVEFIQNIYNSIPDMIREKIHQRILEYYPNRYSPFSRIAARFTDKDEAEQAQELIASIRHRTEDIEKRHVLLEFKVVENQRFQKFEQHLYRQSILMQEMVDKLD